MYVLTYMYTHKWLYSVLITTGMPMLQRGLQTCLVTGKSRKHICKGAYLLCSVVLCISACVLHHVRALCVGVPLRHQGSIKLPIAMANIGKKSKSHRVRPSNYSNLFVNWLIWLLFTGSANKRCWCTVLWGT